MKADTLTTTTYTLSEITREELGLIESGLALVFDRLDTQSPSAECTLRQALAKHMHRAIFVALRGDKK